MSQTQTHLLGASTDIVELYVNLSPAQSKEFNVIDMDGRKLSPLVLPSNSVFVITDVLATPNATEGLYQVDVNNPNPPTGTIETRIRIRFDSRNQAMLHLALTGGVVLRKAPVAFTFSSNPGAMVIRLLGYIVAL